MKQLTRISLISFLLVFTGCFGESDLAPVNIKTNSEWIIPTSKVFDGGPGKDGIPALENPVMASIGSSDLDFLNDSDLVLVYQSNDEVKAYAHPVLDHHEIINDQIGDDFVAITYCPLTGTGIGWGREINGTVTTFGVSGLLYETNLMPYDRLTESYWSQMFNQCVTGELVEQAPEFFNVTQMNYGSLKKLFPKATVTTTDTPHNRSYGIYPYEDYRSSNDLLFPISNGDTRLHPKELVRGVEIDGSAIAFQFPISGERALVLETFNGADLVVVADENKGYIVSFFNREIDGTQLEFTLNSDEDSEVILEDQLGNKWDIFGNAVEGPNVGLELEVPYSYIGYWFAWATFYPGLELHKIE